MDRDALFRTMGLDMLAGWPVREKPRQVCSFRINIPEPIGAALGLATTPIDGLFRIVLALEPGTGAAR